MYPQDYADKLSQIYCNQGELAFIEEFTRLKNVLVYSLGDKIGEPVENSYLIKILDRVKEIRKPNPEFKTNKETSTIKFRAISQLAILIESLKKELGSNNSILKF